MDYMTCNVDAAEQALRVIGGDALPSDRGLGELPKRVFWNSSARDGRLNRTIGGQD
jgi:hypothetical protein